MTAALRGITIVVASGDSGIIGNLVNECRDQSCVDQFCSQTWPQWPASSAYVTTVGATMSSDKYVPACGAPGSNLFGNIHLPSFVCPGVGEIMCSSIDGGGVTSGGGFSNVISQPSWQQGAVSQYLTKYGDSLPPSGYFNPSGRGYPDVSAYGSWTFIYINGSYTLVSGTSEAAPIMAGIVTLWNDLRAAYNMPPMGFLNPFLYQAAAAAPETFNDVVVGDNKCSDGPGLSQETLYCCDKGFTAQPGWDATTGLGTVNYQALMAYILNPDDLYPASYAQVPVDLSASDDDSNQDYTIGVTALVFSLFLFSTLLSVGGYYWYVRLRKIPAAFPPTGTGTVGTNPISLQMS